MSLFVVLWALGLDGPDQSPNPTISGPCGDSSEVGGAGVTSEVSDPSVRILSSLSPIGRSSYGERCGIASNRCKSGHGG